ncbi:YHYH protein [Marinoscillum sp. MHG1-6]|uniref:YHYH protein n=1 Tax=Marinoscillum sp. MHG1-6 TaxID=2959627 RepID=UPI002157CFBA|nr:YHYH protein [Marinoscillum sp. MHG1-6]
MKRNLFSLFIIGALLFQTSCMEDDGSSPGDEDEQLNDNELQNEEQQEESSTTYIDPDFFASSSFAVTAKVVDCTLDNGSTTQCYELTFISNPVPDDGPFCPATTSDVGGLGIYDGNTNAGFQVMKASLFEAMEADGYDIIDVGGNIRMSDFSTKDKPEFSYCLQPVVNDNLKLTFYIPLEPEDLSSPNTIETVELIGVSLDGVPMNGTPPSVVGFGNGNIPSLDACGGHHDPSGYYHWHFISESMNEVLSAYQISELTCTNTEQDKSALSGFAKDGYPIYAYADMDGSEPSDLDQCNGHFSATAEFPDGVYHYHASKTEAPNMPPCLKGASVTNAFVYQ